MRFYYYSLQNFHVPIKIKMILISLFNEISFNFLQYQLTIIKLHYKSKVN